MRKPKKRLTYKIVHPYQEEINPENDFVDIEVSDGKRTYRGSITTTRFIGNRLRQHRKTGENARGSYFCARHTIVVERIDRQTIRRTLEDLEERGDLSGYLQS